MIGLGPKRGRRITIDGAALEIQDQRVLIGLPIVDAKGAEYIGKCPVLKAEGELPVVRCRASGPYARVGRLNLRDRPIEIDQVVDEIS